jgi:sodium/hydrogen antiporter
MDQAIHPAVLAVVAACIAVWGLVSARLQRFFLTAPIAFVVLGLALSHGPTALIHPHLRSSTLREGAEITLAVLLFADACRVNVRTLADDVAIPARLLGIGLPLTIGAGAALAAGLFSSGGLWVAATIGAIIAPTDAALGAAVMSDERVPARVRRVLNVESGLNDGIATPFVNLFLAGALAAEAISATGVGHAAVDLVGGAALGAGVGLLGALLLVQARRAGWSAPAFRPLSVLAIAILAYSLALVTDTNGFVAAFVAGLAFGAGIRATEEVLGFTEEVGTLLSLLVWFSFGSAMLVPGLQAATWRDLVFAVLALTVARIAPVALALWGSKLDRATVIFVGWFGPRGLASVVFGLIAVDSLAPDDGQLVLGAVVTTVALSVLAHGVTASPFARRYGTYANHLHPARPEHRASGRVAVRDLHTGAEPRSSVPASNDR